MVVTTMLILLVIRMIFWNIRLTEQLTELRLRHEQLEEGFADFMDEYYQVETIWPDEYQFTGENEQKEVSHERFR